jgi:uncharacterized protein YbjT (DUF2867 family)
MSGRVVALAGATGLIGSHLLTRLLADERVDRVIAYGRRPLSVENGKLEQRALATPLVPKDIDDAYCALGTTMKKAGSREKFLEVDRDLVLGFAKACRDNGCRRFMLVSSMGADPRSMNFYLRTKGEVEDAVRELGFDAVHVARPSVLDGERSESRPGEKLGVAVMGVLGKVLTKYAPIEGDVVAAALIKLAFSDRFGFCVHESRALASL